MSTFIVRLTDPDAAVADGSVRVAVKDAIDVAGVATTVGCAAVADTAFPAAADAACLAGIRVAEADGRAVIVGKTNLHELCFGITGINPWYGTPVNPLDPARIPGGSSSGSAVAVAAGDADVALGTDTGGSVRIPAACCGIVGLKTTWGRIPLDGVWPLSPSLDTVGPLARDMAGIELAMSLLEPGFARSAGPATLVRRLRIDGVDPAIDAAIDSAVGASGLPTDELTPAELPGWDEVGGPFLTIITGEAHRSTHQVVARSPDRIGADVRRLLELGALVTDAQLDDARAAQQAWADLLGGALADGCVLALPTLAVPPPRHEDADAALRGLRLTPQANLARTPALAVPVPMAGEGLPASLQLIGPPGSEDLLVATGAAIEAAVRQG